MTPTTRKRKIKTLVSRLRHLADQVDAAAERPDALGQLAALHGTAEELAGIRERFADAKGAAAAAAKTTATHDQIAGVLGVSKPYVQQMVYRGRTLDQ